jgi:hydrogenase-4 component C
MITAGMFMLGISQALVLLMAAPLLSGFSRVLRAKMHNRRGPSLYQNYRDLMKLMKRQQVISEQAGWVFRATPYVVLAAMLLAAAILPIFTVRSPFGWAGDLILLIYLFALARFFFALSGLDTGSTFGGMGGRRELLLSVLVEPVMLLVLFVMALLAGSTSLGAISASVAASQVPRHTSVWLGMLAFAFASYVEMGKLPFDLAEAEQELQEGPLTEFSGRSLALMKWGVYLRQAVLVSVFLAVFLPFGSVTESALGLPLLASGLLAVVTFFAKIIGCYFLMALLENAMARVRFLKVSAVTWTALGAAVLSFVFYLANV